MEQTLVRDIAMKAGQDVLLKGWCHNFRSSGSIFFLQFRDGSGRLQCVVSKKEVPEEIWNACQSLAIEASVEVEGLVKAEPRAPSGYEIQAKAVRVVALPAAEVPIGKKEHGGEV